MHDADRSLGTGSLAEEKGGAVGDWQLEFQAGASERKSALPLRNFP